MKSSPLAQVKERFGDKAQLVAAVQSLATDALWLSRVNDDKGLAKVSNAKLLKLHGALSRAKDSFGSRDKLVDAILTLEKRDKDAGYKASLAQYPLPRLLARHATLSRKSPKAEAKAAPAKAAKAPAKAKAAAPAKKAAPRKKSAPAE